jgi:hypothetical protein
MSSRRHHFGHLVIVGVCSGHWPPNCGQTKKSQLDGVRAEGSPTSPTYANGGEENGENGNILNRDVMEVAINALVR